jgi:hypothetical protein
MAFVVADRVKETTTTAGTGTVTLAGATAGFQSFAAIGNGNTTYYTIAHTTASEWEVGIGTYTSSGTTLTRTTVLSSSNSGSLVNFSAGTKNVFVTYPAGRSVQRDSSNILTLDAGTATTAPLDFQSGTNLTTAVAGAMEYDGKVPYFTPQGTQRGLIPGMQYYRLNSTVVGANSTAVQSVYGAGVTLSSSTVYAFEGFYALSRSAGSVATNISSGFGGTATLNNIGYFLTGSTSSVSYTARINAAGNFLWITTAAATVYDAGSTASTFFIMTKIEGTVSVNAGGTFIPQYTLSAAPGGAYTTSIGSYFSIWPVGTSGSTTNVGTWA